MKTTSAWMAALCYLLGTAAACAQNLSSPPVLPIAALANSWIDSILPGGIPHQSQPSYSDIKGLQGMATQNPNAVAITGGTATLSKLATGTQGSQFGLPGVSARGANSAVEFGHSNTAGYGSVLSEDAGSGTPYLGFNVQPGTTSNTYNTTGFKASIFKSDLAGGFQCGTVASASADNQSMVQTCSISSSGVLNMLTGFQVGGLAPSGYVLRGNGTNFVSAQLGFSDLGGQATLVQLPNINANSVLGNNTGSSAVPIQLTSAQITAMINQATASLSGALPAWPNNTTTFFRGDGTYATLNFAALGGQATLAQLPAGTSDQVLGYWGSTVASAIAVGNCSNSLTYSTSTHTFGCNVSAGTGTVTSAGLTAGTGISLGGAGPNPITSTGNITITNAGVTSIASNTGAFTLGGGITNSTNQIKLAYNSALTQVYPSPPTGTTSTIGVMMGLGSSCTITPSYSTRVEFTINSSISNTSLVSSFLVGRYGTGTAPSNGAAVAGTYFTPVPQTYYGGNANYYVGAPLIGIITGLTPGTTYWFDAELYVTSGTGSLIGVSCNAKEV